MSHDDLIRDAIRRNNEHNADRIRRIFGHPNPGGETQPAATSSDAGVRQPPADELPIMDLAIREARTNTLDARGRNRES